MLKQHNQVMLILLVVADAIAVSVAWLGSYWLRFRFLPVDPAKGVPELTDKFLPMLPVVVLAHLLIFYRVRLYRPRRNDRSFQETRDILKAFSVAIVTVIVIDYLLPESYKISRQFVATYAVVGTGCFAAFRAAVRGTLQLLRRRGFNQRSTAIIGGGRTAQKLYFALQRHAWTGIRVEYFIDDHSAGPAARFRGLPVLGPIARAAEILEEHPVDSVFIALPGEQAHRAGELLAALSLSMADVRLVPEVNPFYAMRMDTTRFAGLPILAVRQTPLYGWNAVVKRAFDLVVGGACLVIGLLPMAVIALGVKLTSPGPVLYRQRRMGLDGREFVMLKFRTMRADAERQTGPVWAARDDPRRTRLGAVLRRTSLDELPQLFNVLAGDMSLVGPRPERPELIAQFKHEIPRYMLRHKMKAGMTGYAQVKGLRGDTSLRKRIQLDMHYIENWRLGLDVRILLQTLGRAWFSQHETGRTTARPGEPVTADVHELRPEGEPIAEKRPGERRSAAGGVPVPPPGE